MTRLTLLTIGLSGLLVSLSATAQVDCAAGSLAVPNVLLNPGAANSAANPYVNQRHLFCGELNGAVAKGYHARPGGADPTLAVGELAARVPGGSTPSVQYPGVYWGAGIQVRRVVGPWTNKQPPYSSFFPDQCSQAEVVASIGYAYSQNHRVNAGPFVGPSAPGAGTAGYCTGTGGVVLPIGGYLNLINGSWILNTAYPTF